MSAARRLIAIAFVLVAVRTVIAQEATIGVAEAKSLVGIVLRHQGFPSSSQYCQVEIVDEGGKLFAPGYYAFGASCDLPNTAATSPWGAYLVSPRTGEVLNFDMCKWFGYSDLRRLQKQIMLRTHATDASERQYREATGCAKTK
jgi:hypothetical protein